MAQPVDVGVVLDVTMPEQLVEPNCQGHQPADPRDAATAGRRVHRRAVQCKLMNQQLCMRGEDMALGVFERIIDRFSGHTAGARIEGRSTSLWERSSRFLYSYINNGLKDNPEV